MHLRTQGLLGALRLRQRADPRDKGRHAGRQEHHYVEDDPGHRPRQRQLAFDAAAKGDETARKVIDSWIEYVGVGIANVINTFEPEVICIGGGVSNQGEVLLAPVRAYAENETRNITTGKFPVICACQLHNDAGVIGAAALGSSI
mgnify:FL=1